MKKQFAKIFLILSFFLFLSADLFGEENTSPVPYNKSEFPQSLNDLRRFEIITLGSMPFVTLDVTLVFSGIEWYKSGFDSSKFPNPFANKAYTPEEQKKIILTSLGVSVGIGLADYIVRFIKQKSSENRSKKAEQSILITPIDEDPDAIKLKNPYKNNLENDIFDENSEQNISEYESSLDQDVIEVIE